VHTKFPNFPSTATYICILSYNTLLFFFPTFAGTYYIEYNSLLKTLIIEAFGLLPGLVIFHSFTVPHDLHNPVWD
jgi:hypothetical protein